MNTWNWRRDLTGRLISTLIVLLLAVASIRADDFFLQIEGVQGDSTDPQFNKAIVATGFYWSVTNSANPGSISAGKSQFGSLVVSKLVDRASPVLALAAGSSGRPYMRVTLSARRVIAGEAVPFYTIMLSDVRVSGVAQTGAVSSPATGESSPATEVVSLMYSQITWTYGVVKAGYDLGANKASDVTPVPGGSGSSTNLTAQVATAPLPNR